MSREDVKANVPAAGAAQPSPSKASHGPHTRSDVHHQHKHAATSHHAEGHHLLQVEHLSVAFRMYEEGEPYLRARQRKVEVIHDLSISVHAGEIVAVVGASGSGKTLLADAIMGLFEPNAEVRGSVWFDGQLQDAAGLASLRGNGISLVPQSVASLNPLMKVGKQVELRAAAPGRANRGVAGRSAQAAPDRTDRAPGPADQEPAPTGRTTTPAPTSRTATPAPADRATRRAELFERYGLAPEVADLYPFELSGGMARRVLLCCALIDNPQLIIADEPTPGLDLDLALAALADFRTFANEGGGVLLITHDIELALRVADRVAVFRDGTVVEETAVENFAAPELLEHPFSRELWHALPDHDFTAPSSPRDEEAPC